MEFNEKLQQLRAREQLTQEELAQKLYVSRAAISKWESGRGYPSIDSLKAIAKYFHITIDELIGAEEIVDLAEQDIEGSHKKYTALLCGILDCLVFLLLILPVFGNSGGKSETKAVSLFAMTDISPWIKIVFVVAISMTILNGFCTVVISSFDKPRWDRHRVITGIALSVIATMLFILTRQPYAGIFCLCTLIVKGILVIKSR